MRKAQHRRRFTRVSLASLTALALIAGACSSDEAAAPEAGHHPHSAKLFVNNVDVSSELMLEAGAVTRVEVRFYAEDGDQISGIETEHFAALAFTADTLAVPAPVAGHHFQFDVTAQSTPDSGTVLVGYGHDSAADESTFGPFPVTVTPAP